MFYWRIMQSEHVPWDVRFVYMFPHGLAGNHLYRRLRHICFPAKSIITAVVDQCIWRIVFISRFSHVFKYYIWQEMTLVLDSRQTEVRVTVRAKQTIAIKFRSAPSRHMPQTINQARIAQNLYLNPGECWGTGGCVCWIICFWVFDSWNVVVSRIWDFKYLKKTVEKVLPPTF